MYFRMVHTAGLLYFPTIKNSIAKLPNSLDISRKYTDDIVHKYGKYLQLQIVKKVARREMARYPGFMRKDYSPSSMRP